MPPSLSELKDMVKHFKGHVLPKLSSGKKSLMEFASKHGMLESTMPVMEMKQVKNIAEHEKKAEKHMEQAVKAQTVSHKRAHLRMAKKEEHDAESVEKLVEKEIKSSKKASKPAESKESGTDIKKRVFQIKKEKGVSLKEAWAMARSGK